MKFVLKQKSNTMKKQIIQISEVAPEDLMRGLTENIVADLKSELQQISINLQPKSHPEFITSKEACEILKVTLPTLFDWRKRNIIPFYKIANKIRFKRSDIENSLTKINV